jgi:hypothetical protein
VSLLKTESAVSDPLLFIGRQLRADIRVEPDAAPRLRLKAVNEDA